jgi:hypothetical protein
MASSSIRQAADSVAEVAPRGPQDLCESAIPISERNRVPDLDEELGFPAVLRTAHEDNAVIRGEACVMALQLDALNRPWWQAGRSSAAKHGSSGSSLDADLEGRSSSPCRVRIALLLGLTHQVFRGNSVPHSTAVTGRFPGRRPSRHRKEQPQRPREAWPRTATMAAGSHPRPAGRRHPEPMNPGSRKRAAK